MPVAPLCFNLKGEFLMAKEENIGWIITDPDCLQCCRPTPDFGPNVFELTQVNSFDGHVDGKPFYQVAHGHIYLDEYSEDEKQDMVSFYGYDPRDASDAEVLEISESEADQLFAEMFFETEIQEYCCCEFATWNEALDQIQQITGLNLSEYKEVKKPSLDQQINGAKQKSISQEGLDQAPDAVLGR